MKINVLMLFFVFAAFGYSNIYGQDKNNIGLDLKCSDISIKLEHTAENKNLLQIKNANTVMPVVSKKREQLNYKVNSKIKCTVDLFAIINDKVTC